MKEYFACIFLSVILSGHRLSCQNSSYISSTSQIPSTRTTPSISQQATTLEPSSSKSTQTITLITTTNVNSTSNQTESRTVLSTAATNVSSITYTTVFQSRTTSLNGSSNPQQLNESTRQTTATAGLNTTTSKTTVVTTMPYSTVDSSRSALTTTIGYTTTMPTPLPVQVGETQIVIAAVVKFTDTYNVNYAARTSQEYISYTNNIFQTMFLSFRKRGSMRLIRILFYTLKPGSVLVDMSMVTASNKVLDNSFVISELKVITLEAFGEKATITSASVTSSETLSAGLQPWAIAIIIVLSIIGIAFIAFVIVMIIKKLKVRIRRMSYEHFNDIEM